MNSFEIISIVVIVVLGLIIGVKYLIKQNIKVDEIVDEVEHGVDIIQTILDAVPIPEGTKVGISKILDLADKTSEFVHEYYESDLKQDGSKLKVAINAVNSVLDELDVQVNAQEQRLIEIVLSESLKFLDK
jgi:hypothetical protein